MDLYITFAVLDARGTLYLGPTPWIMPYVMLGVITICYLSPFNHLFSRHRMWMFKSFLRGLCAPYYYVTFADFFFWDQLTSLGQALYELSYFWCTYPIFQDEFCYFGTPQLVQWAACVPLYVRTVQSLRKIYQHPKRHWKRNLINLFKYLSAIIAQLLIYIDAIIYGRRVGWDGIRIAYVIVYILSVNYNFVWDVFFDWGIFIPKHFICKSSERKNGLIGRDVLYHRVWYYVATILNLIIRNVQVSQYLIRFYFPASLYSWIPMPALYLEIFRRFVWNIFRLEFEVIDNRDSYRTVQDLPLTIESTGSEKIRSCYNDSLTTKPLTLKKKIAHLFLLTARRKIPKAKDLPPSPSIIRLDGHLTLPFGVSKKWRDELQEIKTRRDNEFREKGWMKEEENMQMMLQRQEFDVKIES
ncbi:5 TM domain-containing transmembrane protein [Acrasis kona]|uniref:5 TM domain-containing transmembrane protein n=1 Tax=Acrasis kona TaxID=1008807 RepID=A0AAW2ZAD7_9EUKA